MAETSKKGGMSSSSSSSGSGRMIKLRTGDGKKVEVEENIAMQFQTIKVMFEDGYDGDEIPIPNVSSKILTKVIEYCKVHLQSTDPNDFEALKKLEAFDTKFVKVAQSTLFHIILAANYLNITSLMDLTCKTVASIIEKKNVEEIRAYFDVENDYTPEEEEALRKEIEKPLEI